ncbi:MAG TPA: response regulator [Pyrinomonadaceae bacterium]|jgi:twitching motility two-component system response regulator PilG
MNSNLEATSAPAAENAVNVDFAEQDNQAVWQKSGVENRPAAMKSLRGGISAAKAGNRAEARNLLLESARLDETNETVWLWLASISEQPAELYGFLLKVLALNPENERALEWQKATRTLLVNQSITEGATLIQENNRRAAAECFRRATEYEPNNEIAWLWLASATDDIEDKLAFLQRILRLNPNNEKAQTMFHSAKRQMARSLLRKGSLAAVSGDRAGAIRFLGEIMEYDAEFEEAWLLKAFLSETVEEKARCFRRALEINPDNSQAASGLASLQAMPESNVEREKFVAEETDACPFCDWSNPVGAARCNSCKAFISFEDTDNLLVHEGVDDNAVRNFIERLHAEQNFRELSGGEHLNLGFAYLNLKNFKKGSIHLEHAAEVAADDATLQRRVARWIEKLNQIAPELNNETAVSGKTIMVVDDSPTVRKLITGKLEKHGHHVVVAVDGMDALAKINEEKPDLILLDVTMPRLDGFQLCKLIRQNPATKQVPVVMISGKDGFFDKVRGRMAGSTAYITKPFGPETLLQTVENYCK